MTELKETEKITLVRPDQPHAHLRTGRFMELTLKLLSHYGIIVAMPNIDNMPMLNERPIVTLADLNWYRDQVNRTLEHLWNTGQINHVPEIRYMMKLTQNTTTSMIEQFSKVHDIIAVKAYFEGTTTNSDGGIVDLRASSFQSTLKAIERCGLVSSWHFEKPRAPLLLAESAAMPDFCWLVDKYRRMRIIMEHVSTSQAIFLIEQMAENVAGTIAIQHLLLTASDVFGQNHNFCHPVAKMPEDQAALRNAAFSGNPKFISADDSAVHLRVNKECAKAKGGCFNAEVAYPKLVQLFESNTADPHRMLGMFTSDFFRRFYHLPPQTGKIVLERKTWEVPLMYEEGLAVPFLAGETLDLQVAD